MVETNCCICDVVLLVPLSQRHQPVACNDSLCQEAKAAEDRFAEAC